MVDLLAVLGGVLEAVSSSLNPVFNKVVVGDEPEDAFLTSKDWKKLAKTS